MKATPSVAGIARAWVVRPELREQFEWLLRQEGARGQKIGTLVPHVELAELQRGFFAEEVDEAIYREFVLSPWTGADGGGDHAPQDVRWRRAL